MRAAIVKPHHAGLMSLINNVVTCLSLYDYVHVDWSEGCIYGNAWSQLFRTNCHPSEIANISSVDMVSEYPHQMLTYRNAGLLYQAENLIGWRNSVHQHWLKLKLLPHIAERAKSFIDQNLGEHYAAVLVRGNGHAGEQLSGRSQTKYDYFRALSNVGSLPVYVAAQDKESLGWFEMFHIITHPDTKRANSRDVQLHLEAEQTIEDAIQMMIEAIILSRATVLIHPVSNIATFALYANPNLRSIYLP